MTPIEFRDAVAAQLADTPIQVELRERTQPFNDPIDPDHYKQHPSGVECITITEHLGFCVGNAIKYLWRAGLKGDALDDLRKARWYIDREIARREGGTP